MSRAFQNDRELHEAYGEAEHAIAINGKIKVGKYFYHVLGKRFIEKERAVRLRNMLDQLGFGARIVRAAPHDPRYDVVVRRIPKRK